MEEQTWLIGMRTKKMLFPEISAFLERSELDIASKYFELVPPYAVQKRAPVEYQDKLFLRKPSLKETWQAHIKREDIPRHSSSISSLVVSVRSVSLTIRTTRVSRIQTARNENRHLGQMGRQSAEDATVVTSMSNTY